MRVERPFARRIVIGFTLMTLVVSGLFSMGIVATAHFIETYLGAQDLNRELKLLIQQEGTRQQPLYIDSITRFYSSRSTDNPLPERFANLPEGFAEVEDGGEVFYVYTREQHGARYQLVQERHEFENREKGLFAAVLVGFLLSVAAAWSLGRWMARKVMVPVIRLAQQVRYRSQQEFLVPQQASDYTADEVGHLAEAFDNALNNLGQALSRERLFTSDVSHELRTPLMVIATSCELLEAGHLEQAQLEQVDRIGRAARDMIELVQTFLMLARAESRDNHSGTASLIAVATEQYQRWLAAMTEKGLHFELLTEAEDSGQYHHIFLSVVIANLLRNALHYTEAGFVRLIVARGVLRVEDSGIGVPIEQQREIFEPFVRGEQTRGEGLGLGLSLVKRICEHQGWYIEVTSLPAGGSCFRVVLA